MSQLRSWAEGQGLELAAECHLIKLQQAGQLIAADKSTPDQVANLSSVCCNLNSLQISRLLSMSQDCPPDLVSAMVKAAETAVDTVVEADGEEVVLEEEDLTASLLLPRDNYSCDLVRGVPTGLLELLQPLIRSGVCVSSVQEQSVGCWNIYMDSYQETKLRSGGSHGHYGDVRQTTLTRRSNKQRLSSAGSGDTRPESSGQHDDLRQVTANHYYNDAGDRGSNGQLSHPEIKTVQLVKEGGLGLSIVAARGGRMSQLGIFVKAVVVGGAASRDGRIQSGDQLLAVDGVSLVGISQEHAAEVMRGTGHTVNLTIAPLSAQLHGLGHLLSQPSPRAPPAAHDHHDHYAPPAHHASTPALDTGGNDNYQNQEWLSTQNIPNLASSSRQFPSQDSDMFPARLQQPISSSTLELSANRRQPLDPSSAHRRLPLLSQNQELHYQNLETVRQEHQSRSPRPLSLHFPTIPEQVAQPISSSQLNLNPTNRSESVTINRNPSLVRKEPLMSSNFARINSGRFRPIHPAPSNEIMEARKEPSNRVSVVRKGPIRKDGSIVLSPKMSSPALSSTSNNSDKENMDNSNNLRNEMFDRREVEDDNVFIVKDVENVNIEVSKVNQVSSTLPRIVKKVSFTGNNTIHDVTKDDEDETNASMDNVDTPDEFIDEAASIMNLNRLDINQKSSVVGTQEVYNDPRNRMLRMHQLDLNVKSEDGSSLSFKEKLKLFTSK